MTYQVLWGVNTEEGPTVVDHFSRLVRKPGGMPSKGRLRAFEGTPLRGSENDLSGSMGVKQ